MDIKESKERILGMFGLSFAYKFNHKHGCSIYSNRGDICSCGTMEEIKSFIDKSLSQIAKEAVEEYKKEIRA